jgi:hypothetical protein
MNNARAEEHNVQNNDNGVGTYVRATAFACAVGFGLRTLVTGASWLGEAMSVIDLTVDLVTENPVVATIAGVVLATGSAGVTWAFWTEPVQTQTAKIIDKTIACCVPAAAPPPALANVAEANRCGCRCQCRCNPTNTIPWLVFVSVSSSVSGFALSANEYEEGMRLAFKLPKSTRATIGTSLVLAGVDTVYSWGTELRMIWFSRLYGDDNSHEARRRCSLFRWIIAFAGPLAIGYRTGLVIYISIQALNSWANINAASNEAVAIFGATLVALSGTVANFCFQGLSALDDTSLTQQIDRFLMRMHLIPKVIFLAINFILTVIVNMGLEAFNNYTLLNGTMNTVFALGLSEESCLGIALAAASLVTISDLFSSWWEMVKITMGWSQQPAQGPGLFLRNDAVVEEQGIARVIMASRYRMNFNLHGDHAPALENSMDVEMSPVARLVRQPAAQETRALVVSPRGSIN